MIGGKRAVAPLRRAAKIAGLSIAYVGWAGVASGAALDPADINACMGGVAGAKIEACTRLIRSGSLDKSNTAAVFYNRGNAFNAKGSYDLAIADYTAAIAAKPDLVQAFNNRGAAHRAKGEADLAIADYTSAIRLKPDDDGALLNRAVAFGDRGRYDLAVADFSAVIAHAPQSIDALNGRCWARSVGGIQLNAALSDCSETLRLAPKDAHAYAGRALVELRLSDFSNAIADYDRSLALAPNDAAALFGRGVAKLREGESASANEDIVAAKTADPKIETTFANYDLRP